jgi:hypothetical protein
MGILVHLSHDPKSGDRIEVYRTNGSGSSDAGLVYKFPKKDESTNSIEEEG